MLKELIKLFIRTNGRKPNKLELLQLKFKAAQQSGKGEVVEFPRDKITDWRKPRPGEVKTEAQIKSQIEKQNKESIANINRQMIEEDRAIKDMYRTTGEGARTLDEDAGYLAEFLADDAGKFFDDLPKAEQTKFYNRAKNALIRHQKKKPDPEDFAGGGIAGMLGEPTYQDEEHRVPYDSGKMVLPKEKPIALYWLDKLNSKAALNTLGPRFMFDMVAKFATEAKDKGDISDKQYMEIMQPFFGKGGETLTRKIDEEREYLDKYQTGGRAGFKDGKGPKMSRRGFLKTAAGLASIPFFGKFFKWAKPLAKTAKVADLTSVPIQNAAGMPVWFKPLVNKVIKEGDDVTKKFATKEREIVHTKKIGDPKDKFADDITVTQDLETGNVRVEYDAADNLGYAPIQLDYKAGHVIEYGPKKGTKSKPEFSAVESEPRVVNWDGDIEFDGENIVSKVDDLLTDTTKLESYATGQKPTIKKLLKSEQKKKHVNKLNDDQMEQLEYIENKQGHMAPEHLMDEPIPDDFAQGGRVPMWLGGGLGKGKDLLRAIMKHHAETGTTGLTGSKMLELVNPKQFNKMLNRPEGIPAVAKEMIEKYIKEMKVDRLGAVEHSLGVAKKMKKSKDKLKEMDKITEKLTKEFTDKGMDKKMVKDLVDMFINSKYPDVLKIKALPNITDEAILELENIGKNLATKGRKLNASGGLAGMLGE